MKKIAIRKLNRTQLKKEATKEIYITGKILLDFFGYTRIEELATSRRDSASKKVFYQKKDYFNLSEPESFMLSVTRENNEVRLTGFSDHLPDGVKETDYVVLEAIDTENGEIVYLFDTIQNPDLLVLQKLSAADDETNYDKSRNAKGVIQFSLKENATPKHQNAYWMWDDNSTAEIRAHIINTPITAFFAIRGDVEKKIIRIISANDTFPKLLKAISNSNNSIETQEKELYFIEEETETGWVRLTDIRPTWLEIIYMNTHIVVSDRDNNSFVYYGGK